MIGCKSIGVVGKGFVGNAVYQGFTDLVDVRLYDKNPHRSNCLSLDVLFAETDGPVFVCLPTPMNLEDGTANVDALFSVFSNFPPEPKTVVVKSTVPPGTCERLSAVNPHLTVVYNPEFLTERTAVEDFKNTRAVLLGGKVNASNPSTFEGVDEVASLYARRFPGALVRFTDWRTAETVKLVANAFFATKVTFANEVRRVCDAVNVNYAEMIDAARTVDGRLGDTHWQVPGPDGKRGFGGCCIPKDLASLVSFAIDNGVTMHLMTQVWGANVAFRGEKDWEQLKGRAVV